jgi:hypothetical protein
MIKIVSFSMSGKCGAQNYKLQHVCNMSRSKKSVSACPACVVVKIVSF